MTLKNGSAKYHSSNCVFCNSVRYLWAVYIKSANYSKVPDYAATLVDFFCKNTFIRTLKLKFFQKQQQLRNMKNVFTYAVFLSFVKNEMFIEVPFFYPKKFLFVHLQPSLYGKLNAVMY